MRIRALALVFTLMLGACLPGIAAGKYKPPKQKHSKPMKPSKASKAAAKASRAKMPKRPKVKVPKHRKIAA